MSHEHPGDGVRCDHCDRLPTAVLSTPQWLLDSEFSHGLMYNKHERLCYDCHTWQTDQEIAAFAAAGGVTVGKGVQSPTMVFGFSISDNIRSCNGVTLRNYEPVPEGFDHLYPPSPRRATRRKKR